MLVLGLFHLALIFAAFDVVISTNLNVTAVGAQNGMPRFECWQLSVPFVSSDQPGTLNSVATELGDVTNITYNVIPAGFDSGFHLPPYNQWVIVLNGLAVVSLPDNSSTTVTTEPGELGLLFFMDTPAITTKGHRTVYPGISETIFLQIPTKDGKIPEHRILSDNTPCSANEFVSLRGWAVGA
ncbi:hypothetical protein F4677DRAFT_433672 [Hypoxylon crocopeplum]|nr:hypothetical protein F4677DRAFT_433672 [Hypoxylon crocopeplum]